MDARLVVVEDGNGPALPGVPTSRSAAEARAIVSARGFPSYFARGGG
jgi:hypothetical protein